MIQGMVLQDGTGIQSAGLGAHAREGNASDTFAIVYFQGVGVSGAWISRKSDPLTRHGFGPHSRGYAQTARGRTWDFIVRVPQSNT
jgi:hypothetical protein